MDNIVNIDDLRKEIDIIDKELVKLIEKRLDLVLQVGNYKKTNSIPILDENREELVLSKVKEELINKDYGPYLDKFFLVLMNISKDLQKDYINS